MPSNLPNQDAVVWFHNRFPNKSQVDVEELTRVEFEGRRKMIKTWEFFKENMPGFEKSFIILSGPQLGTRSSRRMVGEYQLSEKDLADNQPFEDTIAIFPDLDRGEDSLNHPNMYIPYRCLLPKGVDNLLIGSRCISATHEAHSSMRIMPVVAGIGEAAGVAAAWAVQKGTSPREVNGARLKAAVLGR